VLYLLGITERDLAEIEGAARHPARALRESS
jgi:hypothetical protein